MGYNHHGLVYSINTLSAKKLYSGKTRKKISQKNSDLFTIFNLFHLISARHFITRALLSALNFEKAQEILRDTGVGAADGCSINMTFLK